MAFAFAIQNAVGQADDGGTGNVMVFDVVLTGTDVPGGRDFMGVRANVQAGASPTAIRSAIGDAVRTEAVARGLTIPAGGVTFLGYDKA